MGLTQREIKQRYWDKVYSNAPTIKCKCGCGTELKSKDRYARNIFYINGHNGRKYEDPTQYKREWNYRNQEYRYKVKEAFNRRRKSKLIELAGGKCKLCNEPYDGKNACMFHFHHRNPKEKTFLLGLSRMGKAWKTILNEFKKCDVVCANCHSKIHASEY